MRGILISLNGLLPNWCTKKQHDTIFYVKFIDILELIHFCWEFSCLVRVWTKRALWPTLHLCPDMHVYEGLAPNYHFDRFKTCSFRLS